MHFPIVQQFNHFHNHPSYLLFPRRYNIILLVKILLVGINASYSHTCLAVRLICEYVKKHVSSGIDITFSEFTINQPVGESAAFTSRNLQSSFFQLISGTPSLLQKLPELDFIIKGEGEQTVAEVEI